MATMVCLVHEYMKKHNLKVHSEEYIHTYDDGSQEVFTIETAEKEVWLWDADERERYSANVPTKQFMLTVRGSLFPRLDWFDGKRFNTVKAAINAIRKEK